MTNCDVVVVGAGAAGLAAAATLAEAKLSVCVLEARPVVGGRILTRYELDIPSPIELGAEFVHGRSAVTTRWIQRANSALVDIPDGHWTLRGGELKTGDDVFATLKDGLHKIGAPKRDIAFREFLDTKARRVLPTHVRKFARSLVEGFDAADANRASTLQILQEWSGSSAADAPTFRPLGGYGALVRSIANALDRERVELRLEAAVNEIRRSRQNVQVTSTQHGRTFTVGARSAIVTLPLGTLQLDAKAPRAVHFIPPLKEKERALAKLAVGPVIKVVFRFREAFWEKIHKGRFTDAVFFHSPDTTFPTMWTALPLRVPLLVAWAGGPNAERISRYGEPKIIEAALNSVQSLFGKRVRVREHLQTAYLHNWQTDPFALGAYSYVLVGGSRARQTLSEPLDNTLFFAGEAVDVDEPATVAGALRSGERAAHCVIQHLRGRS